MKSLECSGRAALISNPTVMSWYGERVGRALREAGFDLVQAEMRDGEQFKNLDTCTRLWDALLKARLDRKSPVVALGGGVVGDVAGFIAATYMRGIPLIQVPTTLLAQVDSSVGGKTGIDHPEGKNLIGAFHQPRLVWIDTAVLDTLPTRELRSGLAEAIKYGVIADAEFFSFLEREMEAILRLEPGPTGRVVRRSCELKADVVARDEREGGLRAILNFGHTVGHAVEAELGYRDFRHGEGVALGMVVETRLAVRLGRSSEETLARLTALLRAAGLPICLPRIDTDRLLHIMTVDKKTQSGRLRVVLPERIGRVGLPEPVDANLLNDCLVQSMEPS